MWQKEHVFPVWVIALVMAALSPLIVRFIASELERRARDRTEPIVAEINRAKRKHAAVLPKSDES
jgi:hypothetical protein